MGRPRKTQVEGAPPPPKKKHKKTLEIITLDLLRTPDGKITPDGAKCIQELCMSVFCRYMAKFQVDIELYCSIGFDAALKAVVLYEQQLTQRQARYNERLEEASCKYHSTYSKRSKDKLSLLVQKGCPKPVYDWRSWLYGCIRMAMTNYRKISLNHFAKSMYVEDGRSLELFYKNSGNQIGLAYNEEALLNKRRYSKRMIDQMFECLNAPYKRYKEELTNCFKELNKDHRMSYSFYSDSIDDLSRIRALAKLIEWEAGEEEKEESNGN